MRYFWRTMGLAVALFAFVLPASSAFANGEEFVASREPVPLSEESPGKTHGRAPEGEFSQVLKFGAFTIKCNAVTNAKTINEGAVSWESNATFSTELKFFKCLTVARFGSFLGGLSTSFNGGLPMKIVYHINGFAEIGTGETFSEVEIGSGEASFKISGKICKINWPAQTVPAKAVKHPEEEFSAAVYSNKFVPVPESMWHKFPSHEQERLVIANEFKTMKWSYEEGQCLGEGGFEEEAKITEAGNGTWTGTLEEEIRGGNLGIV
jgi:hypothetical protein